MNIVCVICSDLLTPSDDVFYTPCGHIFHFVCLTQWLERSRSCPQCREKTTSNKIHRIYFNFSNNDTCIEDTCSLQDRIDKLNFQLMLKEKDVKHYLEKSETLEKQIVGLRKEVRKVESEISEKNSVIYAFKEQIKYFKQQNSETESVKQEVQQLQKKVENYKNIQTILEASVEDIDEMLSRTTNPSTLITYISVMKREMTISLNKRRELRSKVRSLQQELTKVSMERNFLSEEHSKRKKLEEDLMICESEKLHLQNKLKNMERTISLMKKSNDIDSKQVDTVDNQSSNVSIEHESTFVVRDTKIEKQGVTEKAKCESFARKTKENETNSPYLPVKSQGLFILKQHSNQKRTMTKLSSSILTKKPRIEQKCTTNKQVETTVITYDGFGGHSKLDQFPNPSGAKKITSDNISKSKKQKVNVDNNQTLTDFLMN